MKSRISWFNTGIAKNYLRRCWPLWSSYFVLLLLLFPVDLTDRLSRVNEYTQSFDRYAMEAGLSTGYISIAFSVLAVMLMFSWLYSAKGSGMMCSLPVRRETLFVTGFVTGLAPMLLADVAAVLISAALTVGSGYFSLDAYMQALAVLLMMNFAFYCFAVFCAMLTGNIIILPIVFIVLNFTAVVAELCVRSILSAFVYGMTYDSAGYLFINLSPLFRVLSGVKVIRISQVQEMASTQGGEFMPVYVTDAADKYAIGGMGVLAVYCLVGLLFAVGAMLILRRRNMESASDVVAVPILKPVFKYCLTGGCAVVLAPLVFENLYGRVLVGVQVAAVIALLMVVGAFVGYFAAEMLIQKHIRVFRGKWKGFIISCCVILLFVAAFEADVFGIERWTPDVDEVSEVQIWQGDTQLSQPENIEKMIAIHRQLIDNKHAYETNGEIYTLYFNYLTPKGKLISRCYGVPYELIDEPEAELMQLQALCNSQEAIDRRCETELPVTVQTVSGAGIDTWYYDENGEYHSEYIQLTPAEAVDLYENYLIKDIAAGTMGRYWFLHNNEHYEALANVRIELNLSNRALLRLPELYTQERSEYFTFNLNLDAMYCMQWLRENTEIEPRSLMEINRNKELPKGIY